MSRMLTTRLDEDSAQELKALARAMGKNESEIVRESIHLMASLRLGDGLGEKFIGLGKFKSGKRDLGSNKKHLKGFGT